MNPYAIGDEEMADIDPLVRASIDLVASYVASKTHDGGMVYWECGCEHNTTTNRYRLCSYHEGFADGVEEARKEAFMEPGTVDWSKRKPFPEGHVGVEGVTSKEVAEFLDGIGRDDADNTDGTERLRSEVAD